MNLQNYTNVNIFEKVYEKRETVESNNMIAHSHNHAAEAPGIRQKAQFNPYTNNMGTTVGRYRT
jgi:hypothetical protein